MNNFNLNPQQLAAVNDTEGAVLVIAGAGSGKTRVLTARVCHLIETGVDPYNILAITFTNKAANEMKERIEKYLGSQSVWTSTFHSMCARILRFDADKIGYSKDFTIYTDLESERVVKRVLQDYPQADPKNKGDYLWHISRAKTLALSPEDYYDAIKNDDNDAYNIYQVYARYEKELKNCNCMDFDDLLLKTVELFTSCPEVLQKYQNRFKYICVDEFQDTNKLQYDIVKMLSKKSGNLFVVGDEDQSIYSWRGAEIRNILDFPKDFPDAKVYKLEQNYRSTTSILKAANNVIKNNSNRNEKNLWSEIKADDSIEYYEAYNDRDEATWVARGINTLHRTARITAMLLFWCEQTPSLVSLKKNSISTAYPTRFSAASDSTNARKSRTRSHTFVLRSIPATTTAFCALSTILSAASETPPFRNSSTLQKQKTLRCFRCF